MITSYLRRRIGRPLWKLLHYLAYGVAALVYVHGTLIDPNLKNEPTDFLDGEKVLVELCGLLVIAAIIVRIRYGYSRAAARAQPGTSHAWFLDTRRVNSHTPALAAAD